MWKVDMVRTLLTLTLLALLLGCGSNFEMKETGGKLYRLNTKTGEIDLIEGQTLVRIQKESTPLSKNLTEKDQQAIQWARANPNDPRANKILAINGIDTVKPMSKDTIISEKDN
jgi:hypothetical protein